LGQPTGFQTSGQFAIPLRECFEAVAVVLAVGGLYQLHPDAEELAARVAALLQPVGVEERDREIVRGGSDRSNEGFVLRHTRAAFA
jgi:hypothetical protein